MLDYSKIKLIIWDLDDTFWKGTLSGNEKICLKEEFINFVNNSLDRGILHSICSKNDYDQAKEFMVAHGLWELFVFPSINWEPKGERVKNIIEDMKLLTNSVLFVDDNFSNLHEVRYYCPDIQTCTPEELTLSLDNVLKLTKKDTKRTRLLQYRLLEEKNTYQKAYSSNEEFLKSCNICVEMHENCMENIERIHELIMRTNQLNYTKYRQNQDELLEYLTKPETKSAYITVKDNFGDYGIVGFYMIVKGEVIHYLFSCRTLGMMVEQYVYKQLGCPHINIVGEVVSQLNKENLPSWINQIDIHNVEEKEKMQIGNKSILFKGPCDISQIFSFIEEDSTVSTEFSYVNDRGFYVEGYNHSSQIVTALQADNTDKQKLVQDTLWLDEQMLDASKWKSSDTIVFSMLTDGNLGIYQHKSTGRQIALCESYYDLTDHKNSKKYIDNQIFTSSIVFTEESLSEFSENYQYVQNSDGNVTLSNLDVLYHELKDGANLILILGSEIPYEKNTNPSYVGRHEYHKMLNSKIRTWASHKENVFLIEITKYIQSQKDYTDTINHFQKKVYFNIAQEIVSILEKNDQTIRTRSKCFLFIVAVRGKLVKLAKKLLKSLKNMRF